MKILLQEIYQRINQSQTKILTDADRIVVHTRYRAIRRLMPHLKRSQPHDRPRLQPPRRYPNCPQGKRR